MLLLQTIFAIGGGVLLAPLGSYLFPNDIVKWVEFVIGANVVLNLFYHKP